MSWVPFKGEGRGGGGGGGGRDFLSPTKMKPWSHIFRWQSDACATALLPSTVDVRVEVWVTLLVGGKLCHVVDLWNLHEA